jgi:hypothetical protein
MAENPPAALAVVGWLLQGADENQIREALQAKFPAADPESTMLTVQNHLTAAGKPNSTAVKGWALLSYRHLYQKMLDTGDFDGCRKVIKEITNLIP